MENAVAPSQAKARKSFRDTASFGARIEYWIIGEMLRQGLDIYRPLVDDMGIDAILRKEDGSFLEIQIKAREGNPEHKKPTGYSGIKCEQQGDYWFIFFFEELGERGTMLLMTADEFRQHANQNKNGTWNIDLGGMRKKEIYIKPVYEKYICHDFSFKRLM